MGYNWETCPTKIKKIIYKIQTVVRAILKDNYVGFYLHGSLAMGGFNPNGSDVDILVVITRALRVEEKGKLAQFFLEQSNSPFPIEISILNFEVLKDWQHPCPYEFHYSEYWRERYELGLLNSDIQVDPDLAAHITITNHRGICVDGESIKDTFPVIPRSDYISSILGDYQECLNNIEKDPIYCSLNLVRVLLYLKKGVISSKQEAGTWAIKTFPREFRGTMDKVMGSYRGDKHNCHFDKHELLSLRNYISERFFEINVE